MTAPNQRTVLVTGGAGYIGSHTCLELLKIPDNQYKVVVVDNLDNSSEESLKRVRELVSEELGVECGEDRIQFRNCDIRDKDGLEKGESEQCMGHTIPNRLTM
jgi:UDP-glucose 4-epimerase